MGLLAGLGSGFGYALYSIFSKIALKKYSWITLLFYTFLFATICLLPLSNPIILVSVVIVNMKVLMTTLALGVFATLLPFLLYTKGIETLEVGTASILTFVEPVVATIIGIVLFNEVITISNVGGILLIIISITVLNKKSKISVELNHTQVRQCVTNKIE
jgi:drug/metabolite transporter (DMT)-like permease